MAFDSAASRDHHADEEHHKCKPDALSTARSTVTTIREWGELVRCIQCSGVTDGANQASRGPQLHRACLRFVERAKALLPSPAASANVLSCLLAAEMEGLRAVNVCSGSSMQALGLQVLKNILAVGKDDETSSPNKQKHKAIETSRATLHKALVKCTFLTEWCRAVDINALLLCAGPFHFGFFLQMAKQLGCTGSLSREAVCQVTKGLDLRQPSRRIQLCQFVADFPAFTCVVMPDLVHLVRTNDALFVEPFMREVEAWRPKVMEALAEVTSEHRSAGWICSPACLEICKYAARWAMKWTVALEGTLTVLAEAIERQMLQDYLYDMAAAWECVPTMLLCEHPCSATTLLC